MPRLAKRRRTRAKYGGVADLTYDYRTGWYFPRDLSSQIKYGVGPKRTWGQLFYDISPLGYLMPRNSGKTAAQEIDDQGGAVPYTPGVLNGIPDPLKLTAESNKSLLTKKGQASLMNMPRL